jgi:hypothetical protein
MRRPPAPARARARNRQAVGGPSLADPPEMGVETLGARGTQAPRREGGAMSSRDWSELWTDAHGESSVHGNPTPYCAQGVESDAWTDAVVRAEHALRAIKARKEREIEVHAVCPAQYLTLDEEAEAYRCDDSRRPTPRWLADKIAAVERHNATRLEDAAERWLESEQAEATLADLCAARAALDAAIAARAEKEAEKEAENTARYATLDRSGWIICLRGDCAEVAAATGLPICRDDGKNAQDAMVVSTTTAKRLVEGRLGDKFLPRKISVFRPDEIRSIGFWPDVCRIFKLSNLPTPTP